MPYNDGTPDRIVHIDEGASESLASEHETDTPFAPNDEGVLVHAVRDDGGGTLVSTDGDLTPLSVDASGNLRVTTAGGVANTVSIVDTGGDELDVQADGSINVNVAGGGGPATIADGADVNSGSTTDVAETTDSDGTLSGKLRGLVKWAYERMPTSLGQKLMAASFPVTLASDQSTLPISAASLPLPAGAATAASQQTDALTDGQLRFAPVPVSATDLDIRDLLAAQDSVTVEPGATPLDVNITGGGGGAVTVADGADVAEGSTTDAVVVTDTTGTVSGKLRGLVKWAYERMPTSLGQKLMAASFPVTLASDQSALAVSGTVAVSTIVTSVGVIGAIAEDSPHVSGEGGIPAWGVRNDADAVVTSDDGDYSQMSVDSAGRTKIAPLPAGTDNIGGVDVLSSALPTGAATEATLADVRTAVQLLDNIVSGSEAQVDIVAPLPAGTNNIGDVDVLTLPSGTLANGTETAVAGTAVEILASSASRKHAIIQNVGTANIRVGISGVTATTGHRLIPGQIESLPVTSAIYAIREGSVSSTAFAQNIT